MIMFSNCQQNPEIFPQDPLYLNDMIKNYGSNRANYPGRIKSYGLSDFLKDSKNKIEEELEKAKKVNLEAKYPTWFDSLDKSSLSELNDFSSALGAKINEVRTKIDLLKLTKTTKILNIDAQVSLMMPQSNPNPITMMTPTDYNNSFRPDDHVESYRSSNTNVDNVYYPVMLMGQDLRSYDHNKRFMQSLDSKSTATTSEDDDSSYDCANSGLQPEVPQCMDMLSCFRD
ncbi:hypothetical protein Tco_0903910 [Tanacetum coccineum]